MLVGSEPRTLSSVTLFRKEEEAIEPELISIVMASSYGGKSSCFQVNLCSGLKNWEIRMHSSGCKIIMHSNGLFIRKARMAVVMWNSCYSVDYLIEFEIVLVQHEWLVYKTENETFFFNYYFLFLWPSLSRRWKILIYVVPHMTSFF